MDFREVIPTIENDVPGIAGKQHFPAPVLVGGAVLLLFYFISRKAHKGTTDNSAANLQRSTATSSLNELVSGYSNTLASLVNQNKQYGKLFTDGFGGLAGGLTGIANNLQEARVGINTDFTGVQESFRGLGSNMATQNTAIASQITSLSTSLAQQIQDQRVAINTDFTGVQDALKGIASDMASQNSALSSRIDTGAANNASAIANIGNSLSALFSSFTSAIQANINNLGTRIDTVGQSVSAIKTSTDKLSTADYYGLGSHGAAACFNNNGLSVRCLENQGRYEVGTHDNDQSWVKNYLQQKYGNCLQNGSYDAVCVGKIIASGNGF